jgi:hypothetical protein
LATSASVSVSSCRNHAAHHAVRPQVAHQRAGVDLRQHRNRIALHVLVGDLLGAPIRADGRELADDQALDIGLGRLVVRPASAVVADLWVGENDDLTGVGGISGDLLVTGKGSVENNLAQAFAWVAVAEAAEDTPVFER